MLEILDQAVEVLGLYGSIVYPMGDDAQKKAIIKAVGKVDDMIMDLRTDIDSTKRR